MFLLSVSTPTSSRRILTISRNVAILRFKFVVSAWFWSRARLISFAGDKCHFSLAAWWTLFKLFHGARNVFTIRAWSNDGKTGVGRPVCTQYILLLSNLKQQPSPPLPSSLTTFRELIIDAASHTRTTEFGAKRHRHNINYYWTFSPT